MAKPTFDLAQELDLLEYDFTPAGQPRKTGPHGIIPEPSSAQIQAFGKAMREAFGPIHAALGGDPAKLTADEIGKALEEADMEEADAIATMDRLFEGVAAVCSNTPTVEEIRALPYRAQQAFLGWIVGTFMDPKQQTTATS